MRNKDLLTRAWRTFYQAALGYVVVALPSLGDKITNMDWQALWTLLGAVLAGAIGAGISALQTLKRNKEAEDGTVKL